MEDLIGVYGILDLDHWPNAPFLLLDGGVSVSCYCGGIFSGKGLAENGSIRRWKIVCICIYGGASGRVRHLPAGAGGPGKSCF